MKKVLLVAALGLVAASFAVAEVEKVETSACDKAKDVKCSASEKAAVKCAVCDKACENAVEVKVGEKTCKVCCDACATKLKGETAKKIKKAGDDACKAGDETCKDKKAAEAEQE